MAKKAVILLSGGLDSTTTLAMAKAQGYACYALSFAYGQKHSVELRAAKQIAQHFACQQHKIIDLSDVGALGGSALTDVTMQVPTYADSQTIPATYVPARNTIFLSIALGWAEVLGALDIFIGVSHIDYSGYPDCRPEFIEAFTQLANLATKAGVEGQQFSIHTPLINLSKAQTIRAGVESSVDYAMTVSCYQADAQGKACGKCDSCVLRRKGFQEAGVEDPTLYQANS
jgi:7-cyano-7-deazaguanine synthase